MVVVFVLSLILMSDVLGEFFEFYNWLKMIVESDIDVDSVKVVL